MRVGPWPAILGCTTYTLTGGEALTSARQIELIGQAIGRPVRYEAITAEQAEAMTRGWGISDVHIAL